MQTSWNVCILIITKSDDTVRIIPQVGSSSIVCSATHNGRTLLKTMTKLKSQFEENEMLDDYTKRNRMLTDLKNH